MVSTSTSRQTGARRPCRSNSRTHPFTSACERRDSICCAMNVASGKRLRFVTYDVNVSCTSATSLLPVDDALASAPGNEPCQITSVCRASVAFALNNSTPESVVRTSPSATSSGGHSFSSTECITT